MANRELKDRGSRKHLLDWVSSRGFRRSADRILARAGFRLDDDPREQPSGPGNVDAWAEFEVEEYLGEPPPPFPDLPPIGADWWIVGEAQNSRRPCLDLIARLRSLNDDGPGILLVESKAHTSEAKLNDAKRPPQDSAESLANDGRIRRRIRETRTALNRLGCGTAHLSAQDHYQLANRLAYSVHLASMGYRVVLLYLGFVGDTYFKDYLSDRDHWQRVVGGYFQGTLPHGLPERRHPIRHGSLFLAVDSLPVYEVSRPPVNSHGESCVASSLDGSTETRGDDRRTWGNARECR